MQDYGFNFVTTYLILSESFYTRLNPESFAAPQIVITNFKLAKELGLDLDKLNLSDLADLFSGKSLPKGATPFSQAYAGHQFGNFTILGDGRAHIWGEHLTPSGIRYDIQFKGSGLTPYSRNADGKAAIGPMLREYIISEAMHKLGIPTTRSLAVVTTGEQILREEVLPGAILTRVASSHIRFGTFEYAAQLRDKKLVGELLDYTIKRHYPELIPSQNKALDLIKAVMQRQADLVVNWMRVGFIHGVMNTDNMTLSGETIDYGPCAFMDNYDPQTVFSSIDFMGRYAYVNQPNIVQWNLARFAETLLAFIDEDMGQAVSLAEDTINQFTGIYQQKWLQMMCAKLGLFATESGDEQLIIDLLDWMQNNKLDYTNTFLDLSQTSKPNAEIYTQKIFEDWYIRWQERLKSDSNAGKDYLSLMQENNPVVIPRNHKVEEALDFANKGDYKPLKGLLAALEYPYKDTDNLKPYQTLPEPGARVYQTFCGT